MPAQLSEPLHNVAEMACDYAGRMHRAELLNVELKTAIRACLAACDRAYISDRQRVDSVERIIVACLLKAGEM